MVPPPKINISAKIKRSSALWVLGSLLYSLYVPPPGSHLPPQQSGGIPALGMGKQSMEKLGSTFGQPSFHQGPEGHDVEPPKDEVCHQEMPALMDECRLSKRLFAVGDTWSLSALESFGLAHDLSLPWGTEKQGKLYICQPRKQKCEETAEGGSMQPLSPADCTSIWNLLHHLDVSIAPHSYRQSLYIDLRINKHLTEKL